MVLGQDIDLQYFEKEQARIAAARLRNEARIPAFLNAKRRLIGIDSQALENQISEKKTIKEKEIEDDEKDFLCMKSLASIAGKHDAAERQIRQQEIDDVQLTWKSQMNQRKEELKREHTIKDASICMDDCGPSALQIFSGEDTRYKHRVSSQKKQLQQWSAQQLLESQRLIDERKRENADYHQYLMKINDARARAENEERNQRKLIDAEVLSFNKAFSQEKELKASKDSESIAKQESRELLYRDLALIERKGHIRCSDGKHVRIDEFRGMGRSELLALLLENENLKRESSKKIDEIMQEKAGWAVQDEAMRKYADRMEVERIEQSKAITNFWQADIREQQVLQRHKEMKARKDRFGTIDYDSGFYGGFGKSCR